MGSRVKMAILRLAVMHESVAIKFVYRFMQLGDEREKCRIEIIRRSWITQSEIQSGNTLVFTSSDYS
jgi:hypothetical protein